MATTTKTISAERRVIRMARLICGEKGSALFCDSGKTIVKEHGEKKKRTNADRIRSMSDEELAEYLVSFKNTYGDEYEGEMSCLDWLKSEAKN